MSATNPAGFRGISPLIGTLEYRYIKSLFYFVPLAGIEKIKQVDFLVLQLYHYMRISMPAFSVSLSILPPSNLYVTVTRD
jgi:hypothetical protein